MSPLLRAMIGIQGGWELGISSITGRDLLGEAEPRHSGLPDSAGLVRVACELAFRQRSQTAKESCVIG